MCAAETNMGQISYNNQKSARMEKKGIKKKKIRMEGGINRISRGMLNPTPLLWAARARNGNGNWGADASRLLGVCSGWGLGQGRDLPGG